MALDPELLHLAKHAARKGTKVSIMDDGGRLLWFAPEWMEAGGEMDNPTEALGVKWLEFVHPDDLPRTMAWIAAGEGAELRMRCHCATHANLWLDVALTKLRAGKYWLIVGDNRVAVDGPAAE